MAVSVSVVASLCFKARRYPAPEVSRFCGVVAVLTEPDVPIRFSEDLAHSTHRVLNKVPLGVNGLYQTDRVMSEGQTCPAPIAQRSAVFIHMSARSSHRESRAWGTCNDNVGFGYVTRPEVKNIRLNVRFKATFYINCRNAPTIGFSKGGTEPAKPGEQIKTLFDV